MAFFLELPRVANLTDSATCTKSTVLGAGQGRIGLTFSRGHHLSDNGQRMGITQCHRAQERRNIWKTKDSNLSRLPKAERCHEKRSLPAAVQGYDIGCGGQT